MEVWALEAYGAAHILKEMLTIKSDDLVGRTQAYSSMIQGKTIPESNIPETFKLLVRQMNGLALGLEALGGHDQDVAEEAAQEAAPIEQELVADKAETDDILTDVDDLEETTPKETE